MFCFSSAFSVSSLAIFSSAFRPAICSKSPSPRRRALSDSRSTSLPDIVSSLSRIASNLSSALDDATELAFTTFACPPPNTALAQGFPVSSLSDLPDSGPRIPATGRPPGHPHCVCDASSGNAGAKPNGPGAGPNGPNTGPDWLRPVGRISFPTPAWPGTPALLRRRPPSRPLSSCITGAATSAAASPAGQSSLGCIGEDLLLLGAEAALASAPLTLALAAGCSGPG